MSNTTLLLIAAAASAATLRLVGASLGSDADLLASDPIGTSSVARMAASDFRALDDHCVRTGQDLTGTPLFTAIAGSSLKPVNQV